uniref:Deoxyribonuclease-2-alpha n=1 Tax=Oryzias latipes TaxID=8090 RepID=A0A3P9MM94_ORYLA
MAASVLIKVFVSVGIFFHGCQSDVRCRNDHGVEVDWYILYKLPNTKKDGSSYLYMDENTNGWTVSNQKIDSSSGCLGRTLKPLLDFYVKQTEGFGYLLYNDQPPNPYVAPQSFGHSKGVVMLDRQTGVWLSHSTPRFPTYRSQNFWPESGNANAQAFMCITFPYAQFEAIGLQLKYIHAYSFDSHVPQVFHMELQCIAQRSCYPKKEPWFKVANLTSMGGRSFLSFAKYTRFKDDLYSGLITNKLPSNLYVKSWGKMRNSLASNCSSSIPHHVYNVKTVKLLKRDFNDTVDHSKWCVTSDENWTCVADMNRETSQMGRGGGALCMYSNKVAKAFRSTISAYERCQTLSTASKREL